MTKKSSIGIILALILIIGGLLGLLGYKSIPDLIKNFPSQNSEPFIIKISPEYFDEGNYDNSDKIPFSIEITRKAGKNITFLELSKSNFKVSRDDEGLNKPTSQVNWKNTNDQIFSFSYSNPYPNYPYSSFSTIKSQGEMSTCKNCFIGNDYSYIFTFTIYYKENGGQLTSQPFKKIIPIK